MKAITLIKPCLLACSVLAGSHAIAGPGTINSIEFSFMSYSGTPTPFFSGSTGSSIDSAPTVLPPPVENMSTTVPAPHEIAPFVEVFVPSLPGSPGTAPLAEVSLPVEAAAVVPEPGTIGLLGLGLAALILRRREDSHA